MVSGESISRRAWFRRSLGVRQLRETRPKEQPQEAITDAAEPAPATAEQVLYRIAAEPAYRLILSQLLEFCITPHTASEIENWLLGFPEMRATFHPPELLLQWMVQSGGIAPVHESPELGLWHTTEAGLEALARSCPSERLRLLLNEEPAYKEIYQQLLEFCITGKATGEIEGLLCVNPILENPKVYPNYLIDRLETAGGLEWNGQWQTTETGKLFLQS
jgi:hypothetical protein